MKKRLNFILVIVLLSSCYYDNQEDLYGLECDTENLTYAANLEKVISESCATTGCHVAGNGLPVYDTYIAVKAGVDNGTIMDRVITKKNMPPSGALSDCNISLIKEWIAQGAKQ